MADVPLCFAIMPITTPADGLERYDGDAKHFIRVARHIFKPAAEAAGFEFLAPASTSAEIIQAEIIANLEKADLVLCDISTWNANVFFELGIRVALDKPVAMVKDHLTEKIPFDNSMVNTHTYDCRLDIYRVEETVPELATFLTGAKTQTQNALWKYFGIRQQAARADPENPEDAKLDLILSELAALRGGDSVARRDSTLTPVTPLEDVQTDLKSYLIGREILLPDSPREYVRIDQRGPDDALMITIYSVNPIVAADQVWIKSRLQAMVRASGYEVATTDIAFRRSIMK